MMAGFYFLCPVFLQQTWNFSQDIYTFSRWNCYYTILCIIVGIVASVTLLKLVIQSSASTVASPGRQAAMASSCFSMVSLYGSYLQRCMSRAGLSSQTMDIDDETTLHFWGPNHSSSSKKPKKPAVILIHGFGPDALWQWRKQAVFLAHDFEVYIPNLVFFGNSTTKSGKRSEVFQAESVGKLVEKLGIKRYSVVGTSYGGFVAYRMGLMWPERVEKVVIASSGVNMSPTDNPDLLNRAQLHKIEDLMLPASPSHLRTLLSLAVFRPLHYIPDFFLNDVLHKLYSGNRKEKMELLKGLTLGRDDTENLSPLQQEVLIVWGEHDQIFQLEKAIKLKEFLGEKARLQVISNTAHVPQIENPTHFNNIIKLFLHGNGSF
ncbi:2-hydroxy-6-oxononadienedioate/2-hydroxy-6-oxononatrienedioate hydrolase 1 [Camellia lanceoleosa]|uniref:2-hydroxy-6-oxononadienedioate/2-hydroxy-6-oxononatrienedioate hydrolase 1 n=1 Tax=Camellia lanceoleosa TaxID=1840588 RepID=A0ACC0FHB6_9ERIC|nr:2-hydroxy-6-oxononadienedioate/2-hydroxy-6-oxononatrienedioate hydrolase 1 [Camellia lanceoleosa]